MLDAIGGLPKSQRPAAANPAINACPIVIPSQSQKPAVPPKMKARATATAGCQFFGILKASFKTWVAAITMALNNKLN